MCDFKHLLGTMTDGELGKQFNLSGERVRQYRRKFNVPCYKRPEIELTNEEVEMLGKLSDREVAEITGISKYKITKKRQNLGISSVNTIDWTPEMISKLGKLSDAQLARMFKIAIMTVMTKRQSLNIPPFQINTRWNPCVKWNDDLDKLLGKDTDLNIAKKLNVGNHIVSQRRKKLGIPKFNKLKPVEKSNVVNN